MLSMLAIVYGKDASKLLLFSILEWILFLLQYK